MRVRSLTDMINDIRQRTNMENSTFVTDAEIAEYLNQALAELWARICQGQGQPFYRSTTTLAVTAGQQYYPLPADFMALEGVEATINGWTGRLDPFMPSEHARLVNNGAPGVWWGSPVRYRVQANTIEILPPVNTFTATLYYVPACPRLVNGSDTFDGFDGYEMAAIYQACATVLQKEESDPGFYMAERDRIYKHIDSLITQRDMSATERVQDVRESEDMFMPYGNWGGWR